MPPRTAQHKTLTKRLEDTMTFLERHGEFHWVQWLRLTTQHLDDGEARAGAQVLRAFAAPGSFDDLVISADGGHDVSPGDEARANRRLAELRDAVREEAARLSRRPRHV
ncbi:hypothetical protein DNL40_10855 [Xylanimonas oleitrophica]|uniref:DUF6966 domain-containing protein n=1 Tax=Xylanimonas oleitrophica TaxID=2607479 RepID=A0A2W5WM42_9MICO|nr:hypothetical protein [Xylanimonas oleitrophica]PZR52609.1 hypothetical protein DNL40_10855 [Xylanimonas oleitrophica]